MVSVGEFYPCKGDIVEITDVLKGTGRVKIRFQSTGFETVVYLGNLRKQEVVDKLKPSVCGIGYIGGTKYLANTRIYKCWQNMMNRCYSTEFHKRQPSYSGCEVCEEWLNFQNFAAWYEDTKYPSDEQLELDKDILIKGNKIYSATTCCWIPKKLNQYVTNSKASRGKLPIGVSPVKKKQGLYEVRCSDLNGVRRFLGHVTDPLKGFQIYKDYKETKIKEVAKFYLDSGTITEMVYTSILNYKIEIGD